MLRRTFVTLMLAGAAGCTDKGIDQPGETPGIRILPATTEVPVTAGTARTVTVTIARDGGYAGDIALTVETAPPGVTGTFDPGMLPNGTTSSVLTVTAVATAAEGTAPLVVRAAGTGVATTTATIQLSVTRPPPSTGAISWKFCDPITRTIWLAVQDGLTGAWKQIVPDGNTFRFDISQAKGAVAWTRDIVANNFVTEVFYGTPGEIATFGTLSCLSRPAATKTLTGTATGFTPNTGASGDLVIVGTTGAATPVGSEMPFQLFGVPDGPRDYIATRVSHTFANDIFNDTLTKLIIRRDVNATGSLGTFDFNSAEAVGPTIADLTLNGTNGEPTTLFMSYITDATAPPTLATRIYDANLALATKAPLYTVPLALQRDGDLHALSVFTGPAVNAGQPNVSARRLTKYFGAPENQALTMGPALIIPTTTPIAGSPTRFRVQASLQADYQQFYTAEWFQAPEFSPTLAVAVIVTSGYAGGAAWDVTLPDLTVAGWDPNWGLRAGIETGTFFYAQGTTFPTTVPNGAKDGGIVRSASRSTVPTGTNGASANVVRLVP